MKKRPTRFQQSMARFKRGECPCPCHDDPQRCPACDPAYDRFTKPDPDLNAKIHMGGDGSVEWIGVAVAIGVALALIF